ncbi:hypothetical protein FRB96_000937 [Tulasnella sp. 330]|nr:hypothetical protein FRB96_000937 [Tulasnella sp. 330]
MGRLDEEHRALVTASLTSQWRSLLVGSPSQYTALESLGTYRIDYDRLKIDINSELGRGGFGVVRRAHLNEQVVAVKILRSDESQDLRVAYRLIREMKVWSKLRHQNILPLIGFHLSRDLDVALIVCPLEPHGSLRDYVSREAPSDIGVLHLAHDALQGLVYLHELNPPVVHGDIKAANALVTQGRRVVLTDFGLTVATSQKGPTGLTTSRGLMGSFRWFSPELFRDQAQSPASDVWAWVCLLLEITKRRLPFSWISNDYAVIAALWNGTLPEPASALKAPLNLWSVIEKCWETDCERRANGASALVALVALIAAVESVGETEETTRRRNTPDPVPILPVIVDIVATAAEIRVVACEDTTNSSLSGKLLEQMYPKAPRVRTSIVSRKLAYKDQTVCASV